jgi:DNA-binding Lrp family transcriptional regulator
LGVGKFAWVLVSVNFETYDTEKFIEKVLELTPVISVSEITGQRDVAIKVFGPSINYISSFVLGMEKLFQGIITNVYIYYANHDYKHHYSKNQSKAVFRANKIDCMILSEKTKNPQINLIEIADKHGLHRNSVSKRWKKLWKEGVLIKEIPDLTQKGYDEIKMGLKAFMVIKPIPGKEEQIIKTLMPQKEIQDIFTTMQNEIVIVIRTENSQSLVVEMKNWHRKLAKFGSVISHTTTSIFLTKYNKNSLSLKEMRSLVSQCE